MKPHADTDAGGLSPFLTYEPFYGLREKPFSLASDPTFFYKSAGHRAAFEALSAGIRRREGLIVLSGEIGTGKTTLCRTVLSQLDRKTFSTFVPDPFVTREDLLKMMLVGFGIVSVADLNSGRLQGASRQDLSYPLYEFLDSLVPLQAFAVLVIDEAQNLSLGVMEEIRILAELEKREKLLQVMLVGQPELRDNLRLPQMRQVEQRVTVRCELAPLGFRDVVDYVGHRLAVAAEDVGGVEFTGGALEAVHLASGGVPRLINLLCDRSLQRGFEARLKTIDRDTVGAAVRDLGLNDRDDAAETDPASDVLPLPFELDGEAADAAAAEPPRAAASRMAGQAPRAQDRPGRESLAGVGTFPSEPPAAPASADRPNPLAEFDSEPESSPRAERPKRLTLEPPPRGLFSMVLRGLGFATAAIGIAIGAGVLDTRAAFDAVVPDRLPVLPGAADPRTETAGWALQVPDRLMTRLTDARAHEADDYSVQVAAFHDRAEADRLVAGLMSDGYRARWVEVRVDDDAEQLVYVDGYGTLENALAAVARLRQQPVSAKARLFRVPGAIRRP